MTIAAAITTSQNIHLKGLKTANSDEDRLGSWQNQVRGRTQSFPSFSHPGSQTHEIRLYMGQVKSAQSQESQS